MNSAVSSTGPRPFTIWPLKPITMKSLARLQARSNLHVRRSFLPEVPPYDCCKLFKSLKYRKIQFWEKIGREDNAAMRIDNERFQQHRISFPSWGFPAASTSVDALSGVEEEVDDGRPRPDQQGGQPRDEHGATADERLLVVLAVGTQGPRRRTDQQAHQGQGQGPGTQPVHQVLEHLATGERVGVRCERDVDGPCRCPTRCRSERAGSGAKQLGGQRVGGRQVGGDEFEDHAPTVGSLAPRFNTFSYFL